jgi:hypothetical protein
VSTDVLAVPVRVGNRQSGGIPPGSRVPDMTCIASVPGNARFVGAARSSRAPMATNRERDTYARFGRLLPTKQSPRPRREPAGAARSYLAPGCLLLLNNSLARPRHGSRAWRRRRRARGQKARRHGRGDAGAVPGTRSARVLLLQRLLREAPQATTYTRRACGCRW